MSGLEVAGVSVIGLVFAWRLVYLTDPEWSDRAAGAVKAGVSRVPHWTRHARVASGLICLGATALVVGTVLPLGHSADLFTQTRRNNLIEHGGWVLIGLAVIAAILGFRTDRTGAWGPLLLGFVSLGTVVWMATDSGLRIAYQYGLGALGIPPDKVILPVGTGPYVAGAGAVLVLLGGWRLR